MNIGIIAEYNPLHNGHVLHFNKIKEKYPNSTTIAIISSEFSQRGELSVFNKFQKASLALDMGIDLVLSNPVYTSMQQASTFAYTNVYYLNLAKVDKIIIGSESNDINLLNKSLEIMNSKEFKDKIQELKEKGYSTKLSYTKALESFNLDIKSNDMLAIYYKDAINKINKNIKLELIKRENSNYLDDTVSNNKIASATYIRKTNEDFYNYVPLYTYNLYKTYGFRNKEKLVPFIKKEALNTHLNLFEDSEGLSNKFTSLLKASNYNELVEILISKRYSESNIIIMRY